jgi:hypothetical protein
MIARANGRPEQRLSWRCRSVGLIGRLPIECLPTGGWRNGMFFRDKGSEAGHVRDYSSSNASLCPAPQPSGTARARDSKSNESALRSVGGSAGLGRN